MKTRKPQKLGSRRFPVGMEDQTEDRRPCRVCGSMTVGLPAEHFTLGYRSAEFVAGGTIWVCSARACLDYWTDALDADDTDRAARRQGVDEGTARTEDSPMTEPSISDLKHDLLSFAGAATRRTLESVWADGGSVYGLARNLISRGIWAAGGAVTGAVTGFIVGPVGQVGEESEPSRLMRKVKYAQAAREAIPMFTGLLTNVEYESRKRLEALGYLPCEKCGVPHVQEDRHQMPPGTYYDEKLRTYLKPEAPGWTLQGYQAADERWEMEDDGSGEQVH